jgi:outer membrane protein, heavy metal efflux system
MRNMKQPMRVNGIRVCVRRAVLLGFVLLLAATAAAQATKITLDEAIDLALKNSPAIRAARTQIDQNKAQEVTAGFRPNPVFSMDWLYVPVFTPSQFSGNELDTIQEFDAGVGYLIERGGKRHRRIDAARDQTSVTQAQIADAERALSYSVAQQFVNALLAQSDLDFALRDLQSFQETVKINKERFDAGDISKGDYLAITVQLLQFQTDVNSARLAKVQALTSLRQLIGFDAVARDYDVEGDLAYRSLKSGVDDLQALALRERPDLRAAQLGVRAAQSQVALAKANAKQDPTVTVDYTHLNAANNLSFYFSIPLAIFNRNQGEIARTRFALTGAELTNTSVEQTALSDVRNAFEAVKSNEEIVNLYESGYLAQSKESRDISEFAYRQGAASLLNFLDAERSYRATQLGYRQAVAADMLSIEQLREAVGVRTLP